MINRNQQFFEIPGFMQTSAEQYDETPSMERIKHFTKLVKDADKLWESMSMKKKVYPFFYVGFLKKKLKSYVKKGVKVLEKKIPIYVELPKYKKVGNGQVKKVHENNLSKDDEIQVTSPIVMETTVVPHQDTTLKQ